MSDIKNIIKLYMSRRDASPEEVANAIGISRATLFGCFREPSNWRLSWLQRVYEYLRVPEDERFNFEEGSMKK